MPKYALTQYRNAWCLYWREDGVPKRISLGTDDLAVAKSRQAAVERELESRAAATLTVAELWARYQAHLTGRPAFKTMAAEAKSILPHFGAMLPIDVTPAAVAAYTAHRRRIGRKDGTILTELNRLSSALHFAVKQGVLAKAPHIQRPAAPPPKTDWMPKVQARKLVDACDLPHVKLFAILALATGARMSALLDLTWDRVDLERRTVALLAAPALVKAKGRPTVPLNDMAVSALLEAKKTALSGYVIEWGGDRVRNVRRGIKAAGVRAGVAVTPHVFRHSSAVWMAEDGVPMAQIAQFLGHSDSRVTEKVYARFSPGFLAGAAAATVF